MKEQRYSIRKEGWRKEKADLLKKTIGLTPTQIFDIGIQNSLKTFKPIMEDKKC